MNSTCTSVEQFAYRGWPESLRISNGIVEAVVVPAIGRVMEFRWAGGGRNVFWVNERGDHRAGGTNDDGWINFGGDKVWPAPQAGWELQTGIAWPPPTAFDPNPHGAGVVGRSVVLTSMVDPHYGIQVARNISLAQSLPILEISTEFRKVTGAPVRTAIWTITQMCDVERVFALLPEYSGFPHGYIELIGAAPKSITVEGRLLAMERNPTEKIKIGLEARSLLWVGTEDVVRIDGSRYGGEFPDSGCCSEIYTNSDPLAYVELETLSPLATLKPGDAIQATNTYALSRRSESCVIAEAASSFGLAQTS